MRFKSLNIDGAKLIQIDARPDERGFFARTFCAEEFAAQGLPDAVAQSSISYNAKAGTVTLHHAPIPALKWPAMTMTFKATPEVLKAAKAGKSVTFTLNAAGDQVTSLR